MSDRSWVAIALASVKGGVGKSTAAMNLAYLAAESGRRVLLWDLDPQGATTFLLDALHDANTADGDAVPNPVADVWATQFERFDVVRRASEPGADNPMTGDALAQSFASLAPWYDVVLFDCAAGLDGPARDVLRLADVVLVPVLPTPLGVRALEQLERAVDRVATNGDAAPPLVLPFFSMVDRRRRLHRDTVEAVQLERPATLSAQIVDAAIVERMGVRLDPVVRFAPHSGVTQGYRSLWAEVVDRTAGLAS